MGYLHIENLYKNQEVLLFKECYALEKIHGTSAHVLFDPAGSIYFHHGGAKRETFNALFIPSELCEVYEREFLKSTKLYLYGEAYGGSMQRMSKTYGPALKFIVFDVKVDNNWLSVPQAEDVAHKFGLEFVAYWQIPTDLNMINTVRDNPSPQSMRNGMGMDNKMEGIVLRPIIEMVKNNGNRIIAKHKRDDFAETKTPRPVVSLDKLQVLQDAQAIADEWVTAERLRHVLDKLTVPVTIEGMREVIKAMQEDVFRESINEVVDSKEARGAVSKKTAQMFKTYLQEELRGRS